MCSPAPAGIARLVRTIVGSQCMFADPWFTLIEGAVGIGTAAGGATVHSCVAEDVADVGTGGRRAFSRVYRLGRTKFFGFAGGGLALLFVPRYNWRRFFPFRLGRHTMPCPNLRMVLVDRKLNFFLLRSAGHALRELVARRPRMTSSPTAFVLWLSRAGGWGSSLVLG